MRSNLQVDALLGGAEFDLNRVPGSLKAKRGHVKKVRSGRCQAGQWLKAAVVPLAVLFTEWGKFHGKVAWSQFIHNTYTGKTNPIIFIRPFQHKLEDGENERRQRWCKHLRCSEKSKVLKGDADFDLVNVICQYLQNRGERHERCI